MNIGLDYDNTITKDPAFWTTFVKMARAAGHEVRIITARDERRDRTPFLAGLESHIPVIYCRGVAKRWYMEQFVPDFPVDVWIDDKPEAVLYNSPTSPEALAEWRARREEGAHVDAA